MPDFQFIDRRRSAPPSQFAVLPDATLYTFPAAKGRASFAFTVNSRSDIESTRIQNFLSKNDISEGALRLSSIGSALQVGKARPIQFRKNQIVIGLSQSSSSSRARFAIDYGLSLQYFDYRGNFGIYRVESVPAYDLLEPMNNDDRIEFAELNILDGVEDTIFQLDDAEMGVSLDDADVPLWNHRLIDLPTQQTSTYGKGVVIAVVDGLFDHSHPSISENILSSKLDLRFDDNLVNRPHGLAVASVAAGSSRLRDGSFFGIAPGAKLLPIAINTVGTGSYPKRAAAINFLAERCRAGFVESPNGERFPLERLVVNCSWQLRTSVDLASVRRSFESLERSGAVCVCSAGNDMAGEEHFPSDYGRNISVAAVDANGNRSQFSNWGQRVNLSAPGGDGDPLGRSDILLASENSSYCYYWGTSFAAPCVSGILAALWSTNHDATPNQIVEFANGSLCKPYSNQQDKPLGAGIASVARFPAFGSTRGGV